MTLRTSNDRMAAPALRVAGVAISHPERTIDAAPGHTKLDVVHYHERMAAWLLPQLAPRPINVVGLEAARENEHAVDGGLRGANDEGGAGFVRVSDIADVVRIVQNGSCEFRTRGASFPRLERPDRVTLDLDPDPELPWDAMREAARELRTLFDALGVTSFVKTTGGGGLHVVAPITRRHAWSEVQTFAHAIAIELERRNPVLFVSTVGGDARRRVRVGYEHNADGATTVAAYSLRARRGLPVSMPIGWEDLLARNDPPRCDIDDAPGAVARRPIDPWAEYDRSRVTLSGAMRRAVGL